MRFRPSAHSLGLDDLPRGRLVALEVVLEVGLTCYFYLPPVLPSRLVLQAVVARHGGPTQFADPLASLDRQQPIRQHAEGI